MAEPESDGVTPDRVVRRQRLLTLGAAGIAAVGLGYAGYRVTFGRRLTVRLGITPGSQTLWRYVAARKDDLLTPLGYDASFQTFESEDRLRSALLGGDVDVVASLVPTVAFLAESGVPVQFFLPIAWLREGYPFVVPVDSPITALGDLVGRRVATYPLDHPGMGYWRALALALVHLDLASLGPIQTLTPDVQLQARMVDAACMGGTQWAGLQQKTGFRKLTDLQTAWRLVSGGDRLLIFGGYLARREFIRQNPRFVADFAQAHVQALQAYRRDRATFLQVTASYAGGPRMTVAENQAQATYLGYDEVGIERLTIVADDVAAYQRLFDLMAQSGYLRAAPPDVASLFAVAG